MVFWLRHVHKLPASLSQSPSVANKGVSGRDGRPESPIKQPAETLGESNLPVFGKSSRCEQVAPLGEL
jgi:hypothetical protein